MSWAKRTVEEHGDDGSEFLHVLGPAARLLVIDELPIGDYISGAGISFTTGHEKVRVMDERGLPREGLALVGVEIHLPDGGDCPRRREQPRQGDDKPSSRSQ